MIQKILVSIACLLFLGTAAYSQKSNDASSLNMLGNGIAAVAEGEIITFEQLRKSLEPIVPKIRLQAKNEAEFSKLINEASRELLTNMVDRIIIVKKALDDGIIIPSSYIDDQYESTIKDDFDGNRSQFLAYLKIIGKTQSQFRDDLKDDIIIRAMRSRNQQSQVEVSPEKIEAFYFKNKIKFYQPASIHLKQIILTASADQPIDRIIEKGASIVEQLNAGSSIKDLANQYGKGSYNRPNGDWGWVKREDLRTELSDIAFSLNEKEFTNPIVLGSNVFILYAESIQREGIQPISQVREVIEQILAKEIMKDSIETWLSELREKAYIRYFI